MVLHPYLGANWAAGIAAGMMYVGLPVMFMLFWQKEWEGPVVRACNYLIAIAVLGVSAWFAYVAFSEGRDQVNAIRFFWIYGMAALYYLAFGRFHIQLKNESET